MHITPSIVTLWDEQGLPAPCERVQRHAGALRAAAMQAGSGFNTPLEIVDWTIRRVNEANRGELRLDIGRVPEDSPFASATRDLRLR